MTILESTAQWKDLFNGTDLSGWTGDTGGYVAEEGILVCKKGGKNLVSEKEYSVSRFSLTSSWKRVATTVSAFEFPKGGLRHRPEWKSKSSTTTGTRYQGTADMGGGKTRKLSWLKPWQYHGSVYGIVPAKYRVYLKPPLANGIRETIVAIDDHIMVILNGAVIVDAFLDDTTPVDGGSHIRE